MDLDRFKAPPLGELFLLIPDELSLLGTLLDMKYCVGGVVHCPFLAVLFLLPLAIP